MDVSSSSRDAEVRWGKSDILSAINTFARKTNDIDTNMQGLTYNKDTELATINLLSNKMVTIIRQL